MEPHSRSFEGFLHLADFPLDLPASLFISAFGFQARIVREFFRLLLALALHLVKLALYLILSTWLHDVTSFLSALQYA